MATLICWPRPRLGWCRLRLWIGQFDFVFVPSRPAVRGRDLAAFRVQHFGFVPDALSDPVKDGDVISLSGITAVAAQMNIGGIGPDDRNGFELVKVERKQIAYHFSAGRSTSRRLSRASCVLGAVGDALGVVGIDVRILKQAESELGSKTPQTAASSRLPESCPFRT